MNLFCFPFAATPSRMAKSALSTRCAKPIGPARFDAIRAGVTDFGSVTVLFATIHR